MTNRVGRSADSRTDELLSITRNPLPPAVTKARRDTFGAKFVTPFPVDPNWFQATWYGERREPRGIGASILRLAVALRASSIHLCAWAARPVVITRWQGQWR